MHGHILSGREAPVRDKAFRVTGFNGVMHDMPGRYHGEASIMRQPLELKPPNIRRYRIDVFVEKIFLAVGHEQPYRWIPPDVFHVVSVTRKGASLSTLGE